jgi:hypothetical protein
MGKASAVAAADVFSGADQLYLAIRTRSGPNVTPELFTVSGDRLVCLTSVATLKSRLLRDDDVVGIAAGSVCATGTAEVHDIASPVDVGRFVRDNAGEMVGAAVDALVGRLGRPLPPRRVALVITPTDVVTGDEPGDAVVGWLRDDGAPLALPAHWDEGAAVATLHASVFRRSGAGTESDACVTVDAWSGYGPTGKHGLMLRGPGVAEVDGDTVRLRLDAERVTYWDGITTGTAPLPR